MTGPFVTGFVVGMLGGFAYGALFTLLVTWRKVGKVLARGIDRVWDEVRKSGIKG